MKIGVVIPSRLALRPGSQTLWLDGALASIRAQTCFAQHEWVIMVGLDQGAELPDMSLVDIFVVWARTRGQSAAVNAAARDALAEGVDVLSFLEDDDRWHPSKMELQLARLEQAPFLSCSQQIVSEDQKTILGINDFPVPSSWVLWADVWKRIGGFDEGIRFHVDTDWIGRLNEARVPRIHLVENRSQTQTWFFQFASHTGLHAEVVSSGVPAPLVIRTENSVGGMGTINRDADVAMVSAKEYAAISARYGEIPW